MTTIEITLPYTENLEVLRLTTDKECYAKKANQDIRRAQEMLQEIERAKRNNQRIDVDANESTADAPSNYANDVTKSAVTKARDAVGIYNHFIQQTNEKEKNDYQETLSNACTEASGWIDKATAQAGVAYDKTTTKTVLVVGGGVSGLMTAWILLDKGYRVSIIAKDWAETGPKAKGITSQIAGALWEYPPGGCGLSEIEVPVLAYSKLEQYQKWAMQSFLFYEKLQAVAGSAFGARMINLYQFFYHDHLNSGTATPQAGSDQGDAGKAKAMENAEQHYKKYERIRGLDVEGCFRGKLETSLWNRGNDAPQEWKDALAEVNSTGFELKWGYRHRAPVIDTDKAIEFLMKLVQDKGAVLETREIKGDLHLHERELMDDFQADIIVNASGLGAHTLANDNQVFPVRGAVKRMNIPNTFLKNNAVLLPAQYDIANHPSKTIFIVPRATNTLVVGSIIQRNNWDLSLTHKSPEVMAMWERAKNFVTALQTPPTEEALGEDQRPLAQGLRPFSHSNVRVSADIRSSSCRVVHNYGHGGSGWTLAVGCAWTCVKLVEMILHDGKAGSVANTEVWGLNQY